MSAADRSLDRRRISVVCPSRLQEILRPATRSSLFVERAIASVREQSIWPSHGREIIVAVDPGARVPERLDGVKVVTAAGAGQAAAVNAGVCAATGDILAIIEDDDLWHPRKLEVQLRILLERGARHPFVSSNQLEVDADGNHIRVHDFATASGWFMERGVWDAVGPLNEGYRWHMDNEWLARLNRSGIPRLHLVEPARPVRAELLFMARYSHLRETNEPLPLVMRTINPHGAMSRIASDPESGGRQSQAEYDRIRAEFGEVPW